MPTEARVRAYHVRNMVSKHLKVVLDSEIEHNVLDKATIDDASVALERLHIQRVMESRDLPSLRSAIAVAEEKGRTDSGLSYSASCQTQTSDSPPPRRRRR